MVYPVTWPLWTLQVASEAESCISGATVSGGTISIGETTDIENTCEYPVFFEVLLVGGGGGGGNTNAVGGGGGAGGAVGADSLNPVRAFINPGEVITVTVGEGGDPGSDGGDSILWLDPDTGQALDPDTDTAPSDYQAFGGGAGNAGQGGSGGGGGANFPVSGGTTNGGGSGTVNQGNDGGAGVSGGGLSTCQEIAGGGGGSYASAGGDGVVNQNPAEGGEGGTTTFLASWGITLGSGGDGGDANRIQGSGEGVCGPDRESAGAPGAGTGAGGGGIAPGLDATPGKDGVVVLKDVGFSRKMNQTSSGKLFGWIGGGNSQLDVFDTDDWSPESGSLSLDGSGNLVLSTSANSRVYYDGSVVDEAEMMVQMDVEIDDSLAQLGLLALWTDSPLDGLRSVFRQSSGEFFLTEFDAGTGVILDSFDGNGNTRRKSTVLWGDDTDAAADIQDDLDMRLSSAQDFGNHTGTFGFLTVTSRALDMVVYRLTVSKSRYITISGLETDWVIKVRDRDGELVKEHTATGSSETVDVYPQSPDQNNTNLLPYGTIIVYDTDGETSLSAIAPSAGIWGGDVYEVEAEE